MGPFGLAPEPKWLGDFNKLVSTGRIEPVTRPKTQIPLAEAIDILEEFIAEPSIWNMLKESAEREKKRSNLFVRRACRIQRLCSIFRLL